MARKLVRKMRGGAQAHLLEAEDGHFYVVKFLGNPQHRRVLVNELIAGAILKYLQITAPETALIEVSAAFLSENPEVHFVMGGRKVAVQPGWHFGSRYPGDPARVTVYDFVPDMLLGKVNNLQDFIACVVFDKWTGNADGRQSVFLRAPLAEWFPEQRAHPQKLGFVALMIDQGFIFNGPHWELVDAPAYGLYMRRIVYDAVIGMESFEPCLGRVAAFPEEILDSALRQIPAPWIAGEEDEMEKMLEKLMLRRTKVAGLIDDLHRSKSNPFANWR